MVEAPRFQDNPNSKVVRLSALVLISVRGWVNSRAHSTTERITSMKNSSDTVGNRNRDLPACSALRQPIAAPGALNAKVMHVIGKCGWIGNTNISSDRREIWHESLNLICLLYM